MIKVDNLTYEYPGKRALKNVSFEIPEGNITALVGPNGAGKTTLLRCIAALDDPFSGRIQIAGIDIAEEPRRAHEALGYLSDFFGLYDDLTVEQCLKFAAWLHKWPDDKVAQQVQDTAALLGLTPYLANKAGTLSRGWRQRLGIAQAIIHRPRLLLLDEPASGLDPEARVELSKLFRHLRDQGMTLVVSSHILAELEDYCTDMLVLREGEVVMTQQSAGRADGSTAMYIAFARDAGTYAAILKAMPEVSALALEGDEVRFLFTGAEDKQQALLGQLIQKGASIKSFKAGAESLQNIYLSSGRDKDKS
jgi:ABC-2 type transport system ATP-binding protein